MKSKARNSGRPITRPISLKIKNGVNDLSQDKGIKDGETIKLIFYVILGRYYRCVQGEHTKHYPQIEGNSQKFQYFGPNPHSERF
jgi:hypothetical protein